VPQAQIIKGGPVRYYAELPRKADLAGHWWKHDIADLFALPAHGARGEIGPFQREAYRISVCDASSGRPRDSLSKNLITAWLRFA
jgi:hypothetical protein